MLLQLKTNSLNFNVCMFLPTCLQLFSMLWKSSMNWKYSFLVCVFLLLWKRSKGCYKHNTGKQYEWLKNKKKRRDTVHMVGLMMTNEQSSVKTSHIWVTLVQSFHTFPLHHVVVNPKESVPFCPDRDLKKKKKKLFKGGSEPSLDMIFVFVWTCSECQTKT